MSNQSSEKTTPKALYPDSLKEFLTAKAKERFPDKKIIILDDYNEKPVYRSEIVKQVFFQSRHYQINPILTYQERINPDLEKCDRCEGFVLPEGRCKECNGFGQRPKGAKGAKGGKRTSEVNAGDMSGGLKAQKGTIGKIDLSEEVVSDENEEDMPELI